MISLGEIAARVGGDLYGDGNQSISGVSGIREAAEGEITFVVSPPFLKYVSTSRAAAFIVGKGVSKDLFQGKAFIAVENPATASLAVIELFRDQPPASRGTSSLAFVGDGAVISERALVFPQTYIGTGAVIEADAIIYPFVYIGNRVHIGEGSVLYPNVTVYNGVTIGKRVTVHAGSVLGSDGFGYVWNGAEHAKIPQIGTLIIEDDVEIGSNTSIDRASLNSTVIGKGTKIDNLVQVGHNVSIGSNSIIVSQVGIAGSTSIGRNVILGGQVGVRDHVVVGDNVRAAGGTGITKDVPASATISGLPHMDHREWLRLQTYLKKLPDLADRLKKVEEQLHREADCG
ncbi:MAG TPA: UDP-3-O-(3-hydroxymyristoyl)glucosamine N-acyltransferase [Deltaproteobacteria bacterium]|nr:UDP-3-O-(3-hydroxymyristoyl)glucosamine N-acyltransferase [Deltaproteobacteria bacterium]